MGTAFIWCVLGYALILTAGLSVQNEYPFENSSALNDIYDDYGTTPAYDLWENSTDLNFDDGNGTLTYDDYNSTESPASTEPVLRPTTVPTKKSDSGTKCVDGLIVKVWQPSEHLTIGDRIARGLLYFIIMCYLFLGVSIVSDRFMAAIERITATEKEVKVRRPDGSTHIVIVRVWNETVANLTLMALGTSAPEILLSIIEVFSKNFQAGDLGPSCIVGSAAFNLFGIISLCVWVIPDGEVRRIKHLRVFFVTAALSIFAYIWMYVILAQISPGVVEVWEGLLTFLMFPFTVWLAYIADRRLLIYKYLNKEYRMNKRGLMVAAEADSNGIELNGRPRIDSLTTFDEGKELLENDYTDFEQARREYIHVFRTLRQKYPQLDKEQLEIKAQEQLMNNGPKSRAFYRIQATRKMVGSGNIMRKVAERAQNDLSEVRSEFKEVAVEDDISTPFVRFEPAHYTVMESCGEFEICVVRRGDFSGRVTVDYETQDGSAQSGSDYIATKGTLVFTPGVVERFVKVKVIDDDVFEQDEQFFVILTNVTGGAILAKPCIATVMILDDDHGGIFSLKEKDHEIIESVGVYELPVQRYSGARGTVVVPYWTEDGTAKAGKDYEPLHGELTFENNITE